MKVWLPAIKAGSGAEVFTRRLANALRTRGIEAEITWFDPHFEFFPLLMKQSSPPPGTDVIHANSWNGFAFRGHNLPVVVTEHLGIVDRPYKGMIQRLYHKLFIHRSVRKSLSAADVVTTVSCFLKESLINTTEVEATTIYNSIDVTVFRPQSQHASHRPFRLLYVGNLYRTKGADLLAPLMRALGHRFELAYTSGLRTSRDIERTSNMRPLGRLVSDDQLVSAYNSCDAVIFPSRYEAFGLVALEAMACGKPVIAFDNSALPEVVINGVTGILCPTGSIDALVLACQLLADRPDLREQYGRAGRERAERLFSENVIIPQYLAVYEEAISRFHAQA